MAQLRAGAHALPSAQAELPQQQQQQRVTSAAPQQQQQSPTAGPSTGATAGAAVAEAPKPQQKKKMCCACPETKRLRDECMALHGEDKCGELIEAHKACLRREGFNV